MELVVSAADVDADSLPFAPTDLRPDFWSSRYTRGRLRVMNITLWYHLPGSSSWRGPTRSPSCRCSSALKTSDAEILLCCFPLAISWALSRIQGRRNPVAAIRRTRQLGAGCGVNKVSRDRTSAHVPRQLIKTVEPFKSARMVSF